MFRKIIIFIATAILFSSCSSVPEKKLKISATTWIGYAPLFYAKEKGWLKDLNIKLLNVSSLSENMYLYKAGNSDAYVGTQYEFNVLNNKVNSLKPIILFDRSNGGDAILSNVTIKELQNTDKPIYVYLEIDSINSTLIEYFINKYNLKNKTINYINQDQTEIATLYKKDVSGPVIIVTYVPYNYALEKHGFTEIASTKNSLDFIVVDAMFTTAEILKKHNKQFKDLKILVDKAIIILKKNPKEFYETIKPYLLDMTYDEFKDSLNTILWINENLPEDLKNRMNDINFPSRGLL